MTAYIGLIILFALSSLANGPRWLALYNSGNEGGAAGLMLGTFLFYWIVVTVARAVTGKLSGDNPRAIFWTTIGVLVFLGLTVLGQFGAMMKEITARNKVEMTRCTPYTSANGIAVCTHLIDSGRYKGRDLAILLSNRGVQLLDDWQRDRAVADFDLALEIDPQIVTALSYRGLIKTSEEKWEEADSDLSRALEVSPDDAASRAYRCMALIGKSKLVSALDDGNRAVALDTKLAAGWFCRGLIKSLLGNADGIADLEEAVKLAPEIKQYADGLRQMREKVKNQN